MGKLLINQVQCQYCGRMFGVNTEDIEWEHLQDAGENDFYAPMHDQGVFQKIECPYCKNENSIRYIEISDVNTGKLTNQKVIVIPNINNVDK